MNQIPIHDLEHQEEIISINQLTYDNAYDTTELHKHTYFEFFFFDKGKGTHNINFQAYEISNHTIHFVFPNQVHSVDHEPDIKGSVLLLSRGYFLDKNTYIKLLKYFYLNPTMVLGPKAYEEFNQLLETVHSEIQENQSYSREIVKNYINILFRLALRKRIAHLEDLNYDESEFNLFVSFLQLVEEHFRNQQPVAFYSNNLGISERKLNGICKSINNTTCSKHLSDRLLLEAKKLLLNSELSIKEILFSLNFSDPSYFYKFFKANTGKTPRQFRKEMTEKYN